MSQTAQIRAFQHADSAPVRMSFAAAVYLLWTATTWLLEKHVGLFGRYDPAGRTVYAFVANVFVGTALAAAAMRGIPRRLGELRARPWLLAAITIAGVPLVTRAVPAEVREPVVLINAFAQILPTSIAEVMTCWLLLGRSVEVAGEPLGRRTATALAFVAADVAFAVYHLAHRAPFDQPRMMAFLLLPGLVTGAIVFGARDPASAILAQNLFAMIGVTTNANLDVFRQPFLWAHGVAAASVVVAVVALKRAGETRPRSQLGGAPL